MDNDKTAPAPSELKDFVGVRMPAERPTPITDAASMGAMIDTRWLPLFGKSEGHVRVCPTETAEHLERQLAEAREWKNIKVSKGGETHPLGTLIELLEHERDEAREQRDRLVEFVRNVAATSSSSRLRREAKTTIAAVKGS